MRSWRAQRQPKKRRGRSSSEVGEESAAGAEEIVAGEDASDTDAVAEPTVEVQITEVVTVEEIAEPVSANGNHTEAEAPATPPEANAAPEDILGIERPIVDQNDLAEAAHQAALEAAAAEAAAVTPVRSETDQRVPEEAPTARSEFEDRAAMATEVLHATSDPSPVNRGARPSPGSSIQDVPDMSVESEEALEEIEDNHKDVRVSEDVVLTSSRKRRKRFGS